MRHHTKIPWTEERKRRFSELIKEQYRKGRISWNLGQRYILKPNSLITDKHGYILRLCKNHPLANAGGYVQEHRLVMEKHLNRFMLSSEVIHHINGNKQDNRISNLEIYSTHSNHMKGKNNPSYKHGRFCGRIHKERL